MKSKNKKQIEKKEETIVKYGIYAPYWTHEWTSDYEYFIPKVKKLGFDVLEISCAALVEKYVTDAQLLELKKVADDNGYDIIHFLRREMLDFTAFPVFFVSNLLLVQRKKYYFNRATVSRNCSIVL